ncbi:MAG: hypothetical protein AVDCRST_MAG75-2353, partial [uncultured Propionibacteriaceae bacterium]
LHAGRRAGPDGAVRERRAGTDRRAPGGLGRGAPRRVAGVAADLAGPAGAAGHHRRRAGGAAERTVRTGRAARADRGDLDRSGDVAALPARRPGTECRDRAGRRSGRPAGHPVAHESRAEGRAPGADLPAGRGGARAAVL